MEGRERERERRRQREREERENLNLEEKGLRTERKVKRAGLAKLCDVWKHPHQLISLDPRGLVDHLLELHRGVYLENE